ncbi:DUF86 domain-containing protein [Rubrivirga sp.]|uniref:HepT-like ribonuclease domain-containing protein n=1 Tax=Rubrivirga sp. TaxID=1885344 RepID=UPI003B52D42E
MADRTDRLRVEDMRQAVGRALTYVEGKTEADLAADTLTLDAVVRNLSVLGEAAHHVSPPTRALAVEIEWDRIVRSRHIVVHGYFGVDLGIVWRILTVHLPPLRDDLDRLLALLDATS